jgi:D-xylose transport system substrate-binding protein
MKSIIHLLAGSALALTLSTAAFAKDMVIGVSWSNFQEERWKTDEAAMKAAIEAAGDTYVSTDAQSSAAKQLSDIESLMAQGVDALIVLAQDTQAIIPAVQAAADENVPVIAYDRLIEDSRAFYLTFDNVEVGRMQARAVLAAAAEGQLRHDQGLAHRSERRLPSRRSAGSPAVGDRLRATSPSSARPIPMAGFRPTPSATWNRS